MECNELFILSLSVLCDVPWHWQLWPLAVAPSQSGQVARPLRNCSFWGILMGISELSLLKSQSWACPGLDWPSVLSSQWGKVATQIWSDTCHSERDTVSDDQSVIPWAWRPGGRKREGRGFLLGNSWRTSLIMLQRLRLKSVFPSFL